MDVLVIVLGCLGFLLMAAAIVWAISHRRFQDPGTDYEAMEGKTDLFVGRSGGGGL